MELLEKIKEMEETELSKGVKKSGGESNLKFSKLEPIQDGGADKLLQTVRVFTVQRFIVICSSFFLFLLLCFPQIISCVSSKLIILTFIGCSINFFFSEIKKRDQLKV